MSAQGNFKNYFRNTIQWDNPHPELLFYKFNAEGEKTRTISKLIIGRGQGVLLIYDGKVEEIITIEGSYDIETGMQPFVVTLKKIWSSSDKSSTGIWFFRHAEILNSQWATLSPVKYLDPQYKFLVVLSAFGNYSFRINNAANFFNKIVSGESYYYVNEIRKVLLGRIGKPMTDFMARAGFSYKTIMNNLAEIEKNCRQETKNVFSEWGFELTEFKIEGIRFDDDTISRINKISD
jgi:membrane protease subunit (stomatin/prohibitin family)